MICGEFKVLTTQKISINTRYIRGISGSGSSKSSFYVPETKQVVSIDNNNAHDRYNLLHTKI